MMNLFLWIVLISLAVFALHRVALWAERRGWIFYRDRKASPGTASRVFLEVQSLLEPGKQHVVEARLEDRSAEDQSGEPPLKGDPFGPSDR